jgi:small subunit ribosomal protein S1
VHISDLSWTQRIKHPSEMFQKGDEVEAVVLNIEMEGEKPKISLGIKQLIEDPWDRIPHDYPVGKVIEVKVIKVLDFGAFVELEKGVEGLIHVSEMSDERVEDPRKVVKPGDPVRAEIITVDTSERKIALSMRSAARQDEVADVQGYAPGGARSTLGDIFKSKLGDLSLKTDE